MGIESLLGLSVFAVAVDKVVEYLKAAVAGE